MCAALFSCTLALYWLVFLSCCQAIRNLIFPTFTTVPQSIIYYNESNNEPLRIGCKMWPGWPLGYVTYHFTDSIHNTTGTHRPQLLPIKSSSLCNDISANVRTDRQYINREQILCLSNKSIVSRLYNKRIHCLANTELGSILSSSFSIIKVNDVSARVNEFTSEYQTPKAAILRHLEFSPHNIGLIPCDASVINSPIIYFTLNGTKVDVDYTDKYRLIEISKTSQLSSRLLLIRDLQITDEGYYSCVLENELAPYTLKPRVRKIIYKVQLNNKALAGDRIVLNFLGERSSNHMPIAERYHMKSDHNSINLGQLPVLVVKASYNISLFCLVESVTNKVATISRLIDSNLTNPRYSYDPLFGVLSITDAQPADEGVYFCSIGNFASYVQLRVRSYSPLVTVYPQTVTQPFGSNIELTCYIQNLLQELGENVYQRHQQTVLANSSFVDHSLMVTWYFNGNVTQTTHIGDRSSVRLGLPSLQSNDLGIYQCMAWNSAGLQESAFATVTQLTESILRKTDYDTFLARLPSYPLSDNMTIYASLSDTKLLTCLNPMQSNVTVANQIDLSYLVDMSVDKRIYEQLNSILPGSGKLIDRVSLLYLFGDAHLRWLKDDRILPLSASSSSSATSISDLNVTLVRSVDFGVYICELYIKDSVMFKHSIEILPDTMMSKKPPKSTLLSSLDSEERHLMAYPITRWLSHSTSLQSDTLRTQFRRHSRRKGPNSPTALSPNDLTVKDTKQTVDQLRKPKLTQMGDNLAVLITWNAVNADFYRIQLRSSHAPNAAVWSNRLTVRETVEECCDKKPGCCTPSKHFYLTGRQPGELEPGEIYQFRVIAVKQPDQIVDRSAWSDSISFLHISKIAPVITKTERLHDGSILVHWTLATSAVGFDVDHFFILYRPEERLASGKITYDGFNSVFVDGGYVRKYKLHALEPGKGYQIVVYGVHTPSGLNPQDNIFTGGENGRLITQFSHEVFVKPSLVAPGHSPSNLSPDLFTKPTSHVEQQQFVGFTSNESNRLMFVILGALVGIMMFIIICLMILCVWRQQRDKQRILSHQHVLSHNHQHRDARGQQSNVYGRIGDIFFRSMKTGRSKMKSKLPNGFMLGHLENFMSEPNGPCLDEKLNRHMKNAGKPQINDYVVTNENDCDEIDHDAAADDDENREVVNVNNRQIDDDRASFIQSDQHSAFLHHYQQKQPPLIALTSISMCMDNQCCNEVANSTPWSTGRCLQQQQQQHHDHYTQQQLQPQCLPYSKAKYNIVNPHYLFYDKPSDMNSNLMTRSNMIMMNDLKREPPSGGSVHEDDTDNECVVVDKNGPTIRRGHSTKLSRNINPDQLHCSNPMFYQKGNLDDYYSMRCGHGVRIGHLRDATRSTISGKAHLNDLLVDNTNTNNSVTNNNTGPFVLYQSTPACEPGFRTTPPTLTAHQALVTHLPIASPIVPCNSIHGAPALTHHRINQMMQLSDYSLKNSTVTKSPTPPMHQPRSSSCNFSQENHYPFCLITNDTSEIVPPPPPRKTHNYSSSITPHQQHWHRNQQQHNGQACVSLTHISSEENAGCAQNMRYYGLCQPGHNYNHLTDSQIMYYTGKHDQFNQSPPLPAVNLNYSKPYFKQTNARSERHCRRNKIQSRHNSCRNPSNFDVKSINNTLMTSSQVEFIEANQEDLSFSGDLGAKKPRITSELLHSPSVPPASLSSQPQQNQSFAGCMTSHLNNDPSLSVFNTICLVANQSSMNMLPTQQKSDRISTHQWSADRDQHCDSQLIYTQSVAPLAVEFNLDQHVAPPPAV